MKLNRRHLLAGSAIGLVPSAAFAQPHVHHHHEPNHEPQIRRGFDPVSYWAETALDLDALDHSIDAKDARAFGPTAAARAIALAQVVMADAVAATHPVDWEGLYVRTRLNPEFPDIFVGGATAWILEYIYDTPAHSQYIANQKTRFLQGKPPSALRSWEAGLTFARNEAFTSHWNSKNIMDAIMKTPTPYVTPPRGHSADPFNPDQGFYGVEWGKIPPLTPNFGNNSDHGPGDPPSEQDEEYRHDYNDVLNVGALREEPTPEQLRSTLFWAYCSPRLIGAPTRIYNRIIRQIAEDDGYSSPEIARILALCNVALSDAGNVCWAAKYYYRLWRPVVAIRQNNIDWRPFGGPRTNPVQFALGVDTRTRTIAQNYVGAEFHSSLPPPTNNRLPYKLAAFTPNFPSYPSGHASFGGASFGILRLIRAERNRGDPDRINPNLVFISDEVNGMSTDNFVNRPRPLIPRTFSSLSEMIHDVNRSRINMGVHWNFDCDRGAKSGLKVARVVYENAYRRRRQRYPEVSELGERYR